MSRIPMSRLALAGCVLALASCATREPVLEPKGTASIALADDKKSSSVTVDTFDLITVALPVPREPGYRWEIYYLDARFLKQTTEIVPGATAADAPRVSFIARQPGRTRVRFLLLPESDGRGVPPVDQQEVILTIE